MKGLRILGDYALEFLVITLLVAASAALVLPFLPVLCGVAGFFGRDLDTRRFKDVFVNIGESWKIILIFTVFELIILIFPALNIYFFNTHFESANYFVLAISYIAFIVGLFYLVTAPTVIANMRVNFRQLLYNGIMLLFGGFWRTLVALALIAGVVALLAYYPYLIFLTLYGVPLAVSKLMKENFYRLKAKALKVSVYDLKKREKEDDYLDENGEAEGGTVVINVRTDAVETGVRGEALEAETRVGTEGADLTEKNDEKE